MVEPEVDANDTPVCIEPHVTGQGVASYLADYRIEVFRDLGGT
jgi:hypothetical protein